MDLLLQTHKPNLLVYYFMMVLKDAKFLFFHYLYLAFFISFITGLIPEKLAENDEFMSLLMFNFICLGIYMTNNQEDVFDSQENLIDYLDEKLPSLLKETLSIPMVIYTAIFPYFYTLLTLLYGVLVAQTIIAFQFN